MHRTFRVKACCVRDAKAAREDVFARFEKAEPSLYVRMELFHGGQSLAPPMLTPLAPFNDAIVVYPQWDEWRVSCATYAVFFFFFFFFYMNLQ
jgi:hypothetical protein